MKCQDIREELTAYLNDELAKYQAGEVEQHLLECAPCARESLRIRKLEEELRQGLDQCLQESTERQQSMTEWLQKASRELSDAEREERMNWVAGLDSTGTAVQKKNRKSIKPWIGLRAVAAVLLAALLLVSYWPQVVRASSQMPFVGQWVQEFVLRDAGLDWAYQNGYIQENLAVAEQDGVRLTILGAVADPVHTTVIYLLDGLNTDAEVYASLREINGEGIASWTAPAIDTPLGKVGMAQTWALPPGENAVTVYLESAGSLTSALEATFSLDREEISRLSQMYPLNFQTTVDGITVTANSVVYTPTQIMVDFTVSGGSNLHGLHRPEYDLYLIDGAGNKTESVSGGGGNVEPGRWDLQYVFNRPRNMDGLQFVIPALGRNVDINLEVSAGDVGTTLDVFGSKLKLAGFEARPGQLDINIAYPSNSRVQLLSDWTVTDGGGQTLEITGNGNEYRALYGEEIAGYIVDNLYLEGEPARAVAKKAMLIVEGNWQINLPAAQ
ncbi:MAG: zf-HC2 domain-containing protein [Bacillota bacterium]|nr:zf-HC2 domain-containing protein [Bacillota bacterium]MDW7684920.1 zf-HC2 domain-containing protein [Bacillota bacterium]